MVATVDEQGLKLIEILEAKIKELEAENLRLASIDDIDRVNHGAHMMAKEILKEINNPTKGNHGFSEPLANEIINKYQKLREAIEEALMHLKTNYDIDGQTMEDSDASDCLQKALEDK